MGPGLEIKNCLITASMKNLPRYTSAFVSIAIPCILLMKDIYGSFIFSFSIPFLWQVVYLNKPISSLGLKMKSIGVSAISGILSGVSLGLVGGKALHLFGLTSHFLSNTQNLRFDIGVFKIEFFLAKELGYQLLIISNGFKGLVLYFLFSILVIGLGEEILWRGFIQQKVAYRIGKSKAILVTAALFALIHFYLFLVVSISQGLILFLLIGIAGAIWGYLYEKTGNIWSAAISHGITAAVIWKYYFFISLVP